MRKGFVKFIFSFGFIYLMLSVPFVFAAEGGARPISMGGAYVAVADDVHAASWNPAGMAWQEVQEITLSGILNSRTDYITGDFISDSYVGYVYPMQGDYEGSFKNKGTLGIYYHSTGYKTSSADVAMYQPGLSYGRLISENLALGASISYYGYDMALPSMSDDDSIIGINLGFLWYATDQLLVGCLWENVNEPSYNLFGVSNELVRIMRPGVAYYLTENTVVACDIYDITGNTKDRTSDYSQDIRLGLEHYLTENLSVRLGAHHPNSNTDSSQFYALGLGWQRSDFWGINPVNYYIDYTFVSWTDAPSGMEDYTHQIGLSAKF